ncbi:MAG: hypothetical protein AAF589_02890 [Planctomycetota bacterium]
MAGSNSRFGPPAAPLRQPGPPIAAPTPVYWGQDVFLIPYQWSARNDQESAKQVILYLSEDRGRRWVEVTRARPDVRSFLYRAPADGEYWFAVRTLDTSGRMWPAGGYQPELCVVVDTQIPTLTTPVATLDAQGRVEAHCVASDANLDPSTLKLAVRHPGADKWTPLETQLQTVATPNRLGVSQLQVRGVWQAPAGVREVTVRASVEDLAQNPYGTQATVQASDRVAAAPLITPRSPAGSTPPPPGADPFLSAPPLEIPTVSAWGAPKPDAAGPGSQPWPADATATRGLRPDSPNTWAPVSPPAMANRDNAVANSPFRNASTAAPVLPHGAEFAEAGPIDQRDLLIVNKRNFALDYDLQSVGKWGVSEVEVWGTRNGGRTWKAYAVDTDKRSPVNISTPEPGRYGFRILVQGVGSLPVDPPSPGDRPEVWVEVDAQAPTARLTSVAQGEGYFGDHLIITWQAVDANLADRPISLAYSSRPSGPWMPIASSLENRGRYAWRLQRHLPGELYVRLEARDRAGNAAIDQTQQPATLRFAQPAGRIRDARPLAN